jgi:ketosteroid isomerase-like protein
MNPALRFTEATNQKDLDAIGAVFHPEFEMIVPQHPARGFKGRDQEVKNMRYLIETYPDCHIEVLRTAETASETWIETHLTATGLEMAAVVIFEIDPSTGTIIRGRYYSDQVDRGSTQIDDFMHGLGSKS